MSDDEETEPEVETENGRVIRWRQHRLIRAGYPEEEAFLLARRLDVDLHTAEDMLVQGCSWKTALKILL